MSRGIELIALIDLIYEAALDNDLWPGVLIKLADAVGAAQVAMPSMDWHANVVDTIAPRFDPDLLASWQEYWAFHDPTLPRAALHPAGEVYTLDRLMPREEFAATPVFNELWRPAQLSLAAAGANLLIEDQFSAMICFSNAPNGDSLTAQQIHIFKAVLRHLIRAVRISRRLWEVELTNVAATERLETLQQGTLLADASGRVVRVNAAAKAMLDDGNEIFLDNGRLAAAGSEILQKLIASCARTSLSLGGPGGEWRGISDATVPEPISRAFSRRPEPTGRLNSSVSCSTPPTGTRRKHERFGRSRRSKRIAPDLQGSHGAFKNDC